MIASDGFDIVPIEVESLVIYAGERFDFIVHANQKIQSYWIRFRGLMDCDDRFRSAHQVAILQYKQSINKIPNELPTYNYVRKGLQLNALNKGSGEKLTTSIAEINAAIEDDIELFKEPDYKFFIYYDFYAKDNPTFHLPGLYGFNQTYGINNMLYTPQLNHISMRMPTNVLMMSKKFDEDNNFCNETYLNEKKIDCQEIFCQCTHVLQVPLHSIVEMVICDEGHTYNANHPFHLHGIKHN